MGDDRKDDERQVLWEQIREIVSCFDARDQVSVMADSAVLMQQTGYQ